MTVSLVVTHDSSPRSATIEILDALLPLDPEAEVVPTTHRGVLLVHTKLRPMEASRAILTSLPSGISKVVPVSRISSPDLSGIVRAALETARESQLSLTFSVRATVRGSSLSERDVEARVGSAIAEALGAKVDLRNPEQIVLIEVVDSIAGVSIVRKSYPIHVRRRPQNAMKRLDTA